MDEADGVSRAWAAAQAALPEGWTLDALRCASPTLGPLGRSDDWVAVAVGPFGKERSHRATDAIAALEGLPLEFEPDRH